jgi:hypothetical protein
MLTVNIMVLEDVVKYVTIEAHECASGLTQFFMYEMKRHIGDGFPFYGLLSINAGQLQ